MYLYCTYIVSKEVVVSKKIKFHPHAGIFSFGRFGGSLRCVSALKLVCEIYSSINGYC